MKITIIGMGSGEPGSMSQAAADALRQADFCIGATRLLAALPAQYTVPRQAATAPEEIVQLIASRTEAGRICLLMSGDPGFYSGAARLLPLLQNHEVEVLPGISSPQLLAARLKRPWQDWWLASAHGRDCQAPLLVRDHAETFFLTGGEQTAQAICRSLREAGFGDCQATVGEYLGGENERIHHASVAELAGQGFASLAVLLVENPRPRDLCSSGLPDDAFIRGATPMTKSEVRAVILSKLRLNAADIVYDVGAGTGSVAVEAALLVREGQVFAIEREAEGCRLITENARRFQAYNLRLAAGEAPQAFAGLPRPDAAFIGGSGGRLREIVQQLLALNPALRLVISAVTLETLAEATAFLSALPIAETEVVQIAVSRAKAIGGHHLMTAQNPVFIISGEGKNG